MIQLAVLKDETVAGQRKAIGKKLRFLSVIAVDRFNVVVASSTGDNPLQGRKFFANFKHLVDFLPPDEVKEITPQLRDYFGSLYGKDLSDVSIVEMDKELKLGSRDRNGALNLYLKIKTDEDKDDGDGDGVTDGESDGS